jgi:fumarylacetoacetate (FAA) hydrolase
MKLASLREGKPDGTLILVDGHLRTFVRVSDLATTMRDALDTWETIASELQRRSDALNDGKMDSAEALDPSRLLAPLPRAYGWIDGTSYLSHMKRARALRGAALPENFTSEPLMSERVSTFMGARDELPLADLEVDMDFEGEIGVILGAVPVRCPASKAGSSIRLITLINDVSLREVLAQAVLRGRSVTLLAKPYPTMAPVAVTPDELGGAWDGLLLRLPLHCHVNGRLVASPDASLDATFTFPQLIAYCASYRPLPSGTVLAAGTVSNDDDERGGACIAERRLIEQKHTGEPKTAYLKPGDRLTIEMHDAQGHSIFGAIDQKVVPA